MKVIYPHTNITCDIKDVKRRIKWDKKQKKKLKLEREKLSRRKEAGERSEKHFSYISTEKDRHKTDINYNTTREFYQSPDWKKCRDEYLEGRDKVCSCCGRRPDPNYKRVKANPNRPQWVKNKLAYEWQCNRILVDHKLPIKYYWGLRLTPSNFQLLCGVCNEEKMNKVNSKDYKRVMESSTGIVKTEKGVKHLEVLKVVKK